MIWAALEACTSCCCAACSCRPARLVLWALEGRVVVLSCLSWLSTSLWRPNNRRRFLFLLVGFFSGIVVLLARVLVWALLWINLIVWVPDLSRISWGRRILWLFFLVVRGICICPLSLSSVYSCSVHRCGRLLLLRLVSCVVLIKNHEVVWLRRVICKLEIFAQKA